MLRPYIARVVSIPSPHVPHVVHVHILQSDAVKHVRQRARRAPFRPCWGRDRGERGLAAERRFIGALDERARSPHAFVLENASITMAKYDLWRGFCNGALCVP